MEKKFIISILFIMFFVLTLSAQSYMILKTKSVKEESDFQDIRNACHTPGYDSFIDNNAIPPSNKTP